jgi:hypothetical protein
MGGDGGSIVGRADVVRSKARAARQDPAARLRAKWTTCSLSDEALSPPIVVDDLGNLFNKAALIERHLLAKARVPALQHIAGLKDVLECRVAMRGAREGEGEDADAEARFSCPVTRLDANGKHRFVAMRPCGCVLAERALKELPSEQCLVCGQPARAADAVLINPTEPGDLERAKLAMAARKAARKASKKQQRAAEGADAEAKAADADASASASASSSSAAAAANAGEPAPAPLAPASPPSRKRPAEAVDAGFDRAKRIALEAERAVQQKQREDGAFSSLFSAT